MKFEVKTGAAAGQRTTCAIVPVYANGTLSDTARTFDEAAGGLIRDALGGRDIRGDVGDTLMLSAIAGLPCRRILLVGLGQKKRLHRRAFRRATRAAFAALARTQHTDAISYLGLEDVPETDTYRKVRIAVETWHDASYRFTQMKSERADKPITLQTLGLATAPPDARQARLAITHGEAIGEAAAFAKDLGNLPPNVCTPSYLANRARALAQPGSGLTVKVLNAPELKRLKMGALLAVTRGSDEAPRFIIMQYRGGKRGAKPVVLVGKGITFDSGGISIKPAGAMDEMKYDMCGAATVLAVLQAVSALKLPINVVGLVPTCENLPSGKAARPGDIVRTLSGRTVEILNTDAEGRLILCDALTYSLRYKPAALIDIATLTGACVVALGRHRSGLLSNSDELAGALLTAGEAADDRAWRLPLDDEYAELLKSPFADFANVGGRDAGTITAASFLSKFVDDTRWAHLDIAGTAWVQGAHKGGTGRPVPLLVEYLLEQGTR